MPPTWSPERPRRTRTPDTRMRRVLHGSATAALLALGGCGPLFGGCCAIEPGIGVAAEVEDPRARGGRRLVSGAHVRVVELSTGRVWEDTTVAGEPRGIVRGEGEVYELDFAPPPGYRLAPATPRPITVRVVRDTVVTVRLVPAGGS